MKTKEQKKQEKTELKLSRSIAHLRRQNYKIDVTHQFKGGIGPQALTVDHIMQLPNHQTIKDVSGICMVRITDPNGKQATGMSITAEPYNKKLGAQIALGRAKKNLAYSDHEPVFKPLVKVLAVQETPEEY